MRPSKLFLAALLLAGCASEAAGPVLPPSAVLWGSGGPSMRSGATSLEASLVLLRTATVYYALYPTPQPGLDAQAVRLEATAGGGGSVAAGTLNVGVGGVGDTIPLALSGLNSGAHYDLYLTALPTAADPAPTDIDQVHALTTTLAQLQPPMSLQSASLAAPIGYYAYLPEDHYLHPTQRFPLLIFLHGAGEKGNGTTELSRVLVHGPPKLIQQGQTLPFIVISPQLPASQGGWPVALVDELVARARLDYRVDTTRVYLTGLSMGGYGTWAYAEARPSVVAAVVPIAGAGNTGQACQMREVPVWAFHGDADGTVNVSGSIDMVNALNACLPAPSVTPLLTIYPGVGHDSWTRTYDGSAGHNVFAWLLTHHR